MVRLVRRISLLFNPIKNGDVFYGDPAWFIMPRPVEMVLHGLKDKYGVTVFNPVPSYGCFRFIVSDSNSEYYTLDSEVFCNDKNNKIGSWKKRSQPRRMSRHALKEYIFAGMLWRE